MLLFMCGLGRFLWGVMECHCKVFMATLQNILAFWEHYWMLNLFLEPSHFVGFIIYYFIKTSMEYQGKSLSLNSSIAFSCIVSENTGFWFYFQN